jgi:hypothetical protein
MKTTNNILMAAVAGIAMFAFASPVLAQYKGTGDDGITASPKFRQFLDEYNRNHSPAPPPVAEAAKMPCAKCVDVVAIVPDVTSRGLGARALTSHGTPTKTVTSHLCTGCGTDWKFVGMGKTRHGFATHTCSACGSENLACCSTNSEVATKGMEMKAKVAPIKL